MKKPTILIVEDERDMRDLLRFNLREEGYRVLTASSAEQGLALFHKHAVDIAVLDIMLPGMDGLEMCRHLRQESQLPILFLTARKSEIDMVLGLKLGGDDYVSKPFSLRELLARIETLSRRVQTVTQENTLLTAGGITLDARRREVRVRGKLQNLGHKEFDILRRLLTSHDKVLSREDLLTAVWGHERGNQLETRTVDQHIARLRVKLGREGGLIETVPKSGYRIKAETEAPKRPMPPPIRRKPSPANKGG